MKLYLVRHGQTRIKQEGIVQGHLPVHLSYTGAEETNSLAARLAKEKFVVVYSSDLQRAKETTDVIMAHHADTPLIWEERLRERNMGQLQGLTKKDKESFKKKYNIITESDLVDFGVETTQQMRDRLFTLLHKIQREYPDGNVLIITHGGPARMIRSIVEHKEPELLKGVDHASISIYNYDGQKYRPEIINDTKHIKVTPRRMKLISTMHKALKLMFKNTVKQ